MSRPKGGYWRDVFTDRKGNRAVGAVLREVREDAGLGLKGAAARTDGLSSSAIASYERGERTVSVENLVRLAKAYEVEPRLLLSVIEQRCQS